MKTSLTMGIYFFSSVLYAQNMSNAPAINSTEKTITLTNESDYSTVDNYVLNIKKEYTSIPELSKDLTASFKTDDEKVRAIFRWITDNISYDCRAFHHDGVIKGLREKDYSNIKDYYYAYAEHVLKTKKGLCGGYSFLFYELCKASGLNCYVVYGMTNSHPKIVNFFRGMKMFNTDHAWNKVMIDGKWYFVDATWASGTCNRMVTRFTKQLNDSYYLAAQDLLYPTHAEEKTESADINDLIRNYNYPDQKKRRPFLNIFYCRGK